MENGIFPFVFKVSTDAPFRVLIDVCRMPRESMFGLNIMINPPVNVHQIAVFFVFVIFWKLVKRKFCQRTFFTGLINKIVYHLKSFLLNIFEKFFDIFRKRIYPVSKNFWNFAFIRWFGRTVSKTYLNSRYKLKIFVFWRFCEIILKASLTPSTVSWSVSAKMNFCPVFW